MVPQTPSSGLTPNKPKLPRDVIVLSLIAFLVSVGFGVVVPVLPVFAREFGGTNLMIGLVVSLFALLRLLTSPLVPRIQVMLGPRVVLAIGMGIVALSSALMGFSQSFWQLAVMRAFGGVGSAMFTVSAMSMLLSAAPQHMRGRAAGFYQGGFLIGGMAGPALGAVFALISLRAPFFFYAVTLTLAGIVGLFMLSKPDESNVPTQSDEPSASFRRVIRDVRYQSALLANLSQGWTSFGVRSALVPILVVEMLDKPEHYTGIAFAVSAVFQTAMLMPAGKIVDTVGRKPAMLIGSSIAAVSILALPFADNFVFFVALLSIYGMSSAFNGTAPAAIVGDVAGRNKGTPVAVFSMTSDVGAIVGPLVAGYLADHVSFGLAFAVGGAFFVLTALWATRIPRQSATAS